ncbi:hypothetical protein E2C01_037346 [Portunus trituberculatus]|uniref:Uncharacterized protein n=1 Tax=Portunus trituberculatus TaxID=210409 RepID=A0A5B7FGV3_PORTR|nr:hypothetical protein [Portunus trituberculatus]
MLGVNSAESSYSSRHLDLAYFTRAASVHLSLAAASLFISRSSDDTLHPFHAGLWTWRRYDGRNSWPGSQVVEALASPASHRLSRWHSRPRFVCPRRLWRVTVRLVWVPPPPPPPPPDGQGGGVREAWQGTRAQAQIFNEKVGGEDTRRAKLGVRQWAFYLRLGRAKESEWAVQGRGAARPGAGPPLHCSRGPRGSGQTSSPHFYPPVSLSAHCIDLLTRAGARLVMLAGDLARALVYTVAAARERDTHTPPHISFSTAPATVPQQVSLTQSPCGCRGARVTGVGRPSARLCLSLWNRQRGRTALAGRGALGRSPGGIASVNQRFFAYLPGRDRRQVKVTSGKSYCAPPAQWTPAPPYMLADDSTETTTLVQQR